LKTLDKTQHILDGGSRSEGPGPCGTRGSPQLPERRCSSWKTLTKHQFEPVTSSLLFDQVAALLCYDPGVRSGAQDASRAMTAAAVRVRSVLGNHRRLFNKTAMKQLRSDLEWLTEAIGPLSYSTRVYEQTQPNIQEPWQNEAAQASGRPGTAQGTAYLAAYNVALTALESDRYFRLVADLQLLCSTPPVKQAPRTRLRGNG
jgi:hypothetical protein